MQISERLAHILEAKISWREIERGGNEFMAQVDGHTCNLRMNDFPSEPLYTLMVDEEQIDLDDSPPNWTIPAMPT